MFKNVLVAIHPTNHEEGRQALKEALRLLAADGQVHLVTVCRAGGTGFFPHVVETDPDAQESEVRQSLQNLAEKHLPAELYLNVNVHVLTGDPAEQLTALAAQLENDLIILTSRGAGSRWALRRATVEHVSVCAPCTVMVLQTDIEDD